MVYTHMCSIYNFCSKIPCTRNHSSAIPMTPWPEYPLGLLLDRLNHGSTQSSFGSQDGILISLAEWFAHLPSQLCRWSASSQMPMILSSEHSITYCLKLLHCGAIHTSLGSHDEAWVPPQNRYAYLGMQSMIHCTWSYNSQMLIPLELLNCCSNHLSFESQARVQ